MISDPYYLLPPLFSTAVSLILAALVFRSSRRDTPTWLFCGMLLAVAAWSFFTFVLRSSSDVYEALVWEKVIAITAFATFALYYHFTAAYSGKITKRRGSVIASCYLFLIVAAALAPTNLVIESVRIEYYGYTPVLGPLAILLSIGIIFWLGAGAYNLLKQYRRTFSREEKNRLLYLLVAAIFPLAGGMVDGFSNLPPVSIWSNMIFFVLCSIAILKYHLLDIRVVVRKSLVYLFISSVVAIPYVSILLLLNHIISLSLEPWWVHAILILLLAIMLRPLYSWAQHLVDRLFYQDRYDYLKALGQFSQKAQSVVNLDELSSTFIQLVNGALRTSSVCLLLPSESGDGLLVVSSIGLNSPPSGVVLTNRSPLIKWLNTQQRILSSEEFNIIPQLQSLSLREKKNLEQMEAKLYVPIHASPGQLSAILVLGQKLSQQPYSSEDRQLLTTMSSQMAISLENARLYDASQQEVKERKQAEEALQAEKNKLQSLMDALEDGLSIQDRDYNIIYQNEPVRRRHGDRLGEKCYRVYEGNRKICEACPTERAFNDGKSHISERRVVLPSRGVTFWEVTANPIRDARGEVISCLEVARDITKHKQAEEREKELHQELYLSSRLASIGELAAGVAHQINNPLTGILGFSQRLLRKSTDQEARQNLGRIYTEAERAAKVVQNLLTFARRREPKKEYSNINDVVQSALELRAYELKTSNIEVVTHLAPGLPQVMLDFHQMQEVFLNIILNAEQAMTEAHNGGRLTIKTGKIKNDVRITFTDDGPGIPVEHLNKIFDPFFSTKREKGGTGLGLSICHGIITEHGGRIYAKNKPGNCTTFFVELTIIAKE